VLPQYTYALIYARLIGAFFVWTPIIKWHFSIYARYSFFGLTPFAWLLPIMLTPYFWRKYHFWFTPFLDLRPRFQESHQGVKQGLGVYDLRISTTALRSTTARDNKHQSTKWLPTSAMSQDCAISWQRCIHKMASNQCNVPGLCNQLTKVHPLGHSAPSAVSGWGNVSRKP
jgi:hypothetical protein